MLPVKVWLAPSQAVVDVIRYVPGFGYKNAVRYMCGWGVTIKVRLTPVWTPVWFI